MGEKFSFLCKTSSFYFQLIDLNTIQLNNSFPRYLKPASRAATFQTFDSKKNETIDFSVIALLIIERRGCKTNVKHFETLSELKVITEVVRNRHDSNFVRQNPLLSRFHLIPFRSKIKNLKQIKKSSRRSNQFRHCFCSEPLLEE